MKKISIMLLALVISCLLMISFVANMAEKEIKTVLSENQGADLSIELISYERNFFTATAISEVHILVDKASPLSFKITTTINHYPYQAALNNVIEISDQAIARQAKLYFGTAQWARSTGSINLFSQLTGQLTISAGKYKNESEALSSEALVVDYQVNLKNNNVDFKLNWAGFTGTTYGTVINVSALKLSGHMRELLTQGDYDYQLQIEEIAVQQNDKHSLLEGLGLKGSSQQGLQQQTIDTTNELTIDSYQINTDERQVFTDNRLKLTLAGLYQPAFEFLNAGSGDREEIEYALIELVNHGAQLTLSQLNSQTPWGEVEGKLDLVLDKGASLTDIIINPYILFIT